MASKIEKHCSLTEVFYYSSRKLSFISLLVLNVLLTSHFCKTSFIVDDKILNTNEKET